MTHRNFCRGTLLLALIAGAAGHAAHADLGPKPTVRFTITADNGARVKNGVLLMCEKDDCSDAALLEELGPQHFSCHDSECRGVAYGFSPYLQLQIALSDGRKLTSQVFRKEAFDATFVAKATDDQLHVEEQLKQVGQ